MLIEKFEEQVKKTPHHISICTDSRSISYQALNRYANRVALLIKANDQKFPQVENIGLLLEHGADMIAAILGTLKAGKTYVPLSPTYPPNRITYILEHAEATLILTNSTCEELAKKAIPGNQITILNIDNILASPFDLYDDINPTREIDEEKRAYIMYTSGSTGKPKGVIQNHKNILYYTWNWTRRFSISAADRMTLFSSFCHDGSVQDMFSALLNGAALYPYDVRFRNDSLKLSQFLIREKITIWHSVPSLFNFFINTLTDQENFEDLRC
ncbi:MAG: AMP-binding protein, partial [Acidobacteria bacterium]|nr:AMP-binding protein [Acidobacteriota bacterium]